MPQPAADGEGAGGGQDRLVEVEERRDPGSVGRGGGHRSTLRRALPLGPTGGARRTPRGRLLESRNTVTLTTGLPPALWTRSRPPRRAGSGGPCVPPAGAAPISAAVGRAGSCVHTPGAARPSTPRRRRPPPPPAGRLGWAPRPASVRSRRRARDRRQSAQRGARTRRPGASLCLVDDPDLRAALLTACREVGRSPADVREVGHAGGRRRCRVAWSAAALVLRGRGLGRRAGGPAPAARGGPRRPRHRRRRPRAARPGAGPWPSGPSTSSSCPRGRGWLRERLLRAVRPRGRCVAVVGARGGAGATATAVVAGHGGRGGGPAGGARRPRPASARASTWRWVPRTCPACAGTDLHDVRAPLPPGGLSAALPVADGVSVLAWGRGAGPRAGGRPGRGRGPPWTSTTWSSSTCPALGDPAAAAVAAAGRRPALRLPQRGPGRGRRRPLVLRRWGGGAERHLLVRGPAPGGLRAGDAGDRGPGGPGAARRRCRPPPGRWPGSTSCGPSPGWRPRSSAGEPFGVGRAQPAAALGATVGGRGAAGGPGPCRLTPTTPRDRCGPCWPPRA